VKAVIDSLREVGIKIIWIVGKRVLLGLHIWTVVPRITGFVGMDYLGKTMENARCFL
jgi:hypothetical protein